MAVSPNSVCEDFCIWMQATSWLKITASQNVFIEEVKDAAAAAGTVTEHVWNEFLRTTGLWYQYYTAYIAQTTPTPAPWIDYSADTTLVGFSSTVEKRVFYKIDGSSFYLMFAFQGTSNSATFTFTIAQNIALFANMQLFLIDVRNNSVYGTGVCYPTVGSNVITINSSPAFAGFVASGNKSAFGVMILAI